MANKKQARKFEDYTVLPVAQANQIEKTEIMHRYQDDLSKQLEEFYRQWDWLVTRKQCLPRSGYAPRTFTSLEESLGDVDAFIADLFQVGVEATKLQYNLNNLLRVMKKKC